MSVDLFKLLPALYRIRDGQVANSQQLLTVEEAAELGSLRALTPPLAPDQQARLEELTAKAARGPLESLLLVIGEQIAAISEDLEQLYDDQFIETCAQWAIPYIGDLIGYRSVKGIAPAIDNPRAEVAETISLRRRKGTILVIEQLARDATDWGAHAVEFFRLLGDTQYMNHIRPENRYAPDLRRWERGLYVDSGFDQASHRVDVRRIASGRGRYNIQDVGVFLWTLGAYPVTGAPATAATTNVPTQRCYRFSSLGNDAPLFHRAVYQGRQITAPAGPANVPDRLRRRVLCEDLGKGVGAAYYGPGKSLLLMLDGKPVNPYQIEVANLSGADGSWVNLPPAGSPYAAVVDPELGRIALPPAAGAAPSLQVSYHYGSAADLGGGEYARSDSFLVDDPARVYPYPDTAAAPRYTTLPAALTYAVGELSQHGSVALEIAASDTLILTAALTADLPAGTTLELRAADGARPTLLLEDELTVTGDADSTFALNGCIVAAGAGMTPGSPAPAALVRLPTKRPDGSASRLQALRLRHCTLVPGWSPAPDGSPVHADAPALVAEPAGVEVVAERAILGAVRTPPFAIANLTDSVVDATGRTSVAYAALDGAAGGGALTLNGCTVVGKVHTTLLTLASNSIFWAARGAGDGWASGLVADRKQEGCVRFSFLPYKAVTPRRFECVEQAPASAQPLFRSERYGDPAYLKLLAGTSDLIRRGADDGGEMGALHFVLAPQRESDLNTRINEYLPVGLESGLIYET
jgi:hypothetical protein